MQIHQLQPKHKNRGKKRVGRGGHKGTYSGHGMKGQKARAGRKMVPIIRELIKKYPKLKGYRRFAMPDNCVVVSVEKLEKNFNDGDIVNPDNLVKKGIIGKINGKIPQVKILGNPKGVAVLNKKITVENCKVSKNAKEAIEKSGGKIK